MERNEATMEWKTCMHKRRRLHHSEMYEETTEEKNRATIETVRNEHTSAIQHTEDNDQRTPEDSTRKKKTNRNKFNNRLVLKNPLKRDQNKPNAAPDKRIWRLMQQPTNQF